MELLRAGLTLNTAVLGSISGAGLALKTFSETKDYKRKIEMCTFAYKTYQKVLLDLRTALRRGLFDENDFLKESNILDDTITDFCPSVIKFENSINNTLNNSSPIQQILNNVRYKIQQDGGLTTTEHVPG